MRALPHVTLLLLVGCRSAPPPTKAEALVATAAASQPGLELGVAIAWHGKLVLARNPDRVFRIGSITKQFAAALVLRLARAGKLSLDDELSRHLPDVATHGHRITLRQLLTHTSGLPDYEHGAWLEAHMEEDRPLAELLASIAAEPLAFEPGAQWAYSNTNYLLLGLVIERVTAEPFATAVEAMLAELGIRGVRYCPDEQRYAGAVEGHGPRGKPARPFRMRYAGAAGAMCATAPGLVAWARALGTGKVVDAASWRAMTTPAALAGGRSFGYGFGVFLGELGGHRAVFHSGGINGFAAQLSTYPDDELYIATLTNAEDGPAGALTEALARELLGVPMPAVEDLAIPAAEAEAAAGTYEIAAAGVTLEIVRDGDALFAIIDGARAPLARQRDGSYRLGGEVELRFTPGGLELRQAGMVFTGARR